MRSNDGTNQKENSHKIQLHKKNSKYSKNKKGKKPAISPNIGGL